MTDHRFIQNLRDQFSRGAFADCARSDRAGRGGGDRLERVDRRRLPGGRLTSASRWRWRRGRRQLQPHGRDDARRRRTSRPPPPPLGDHRLRRLDQGRRPERDRPRACGAPPGSARAAGRPARRPSRRQPRRPRRLLALSR